VINPYFEEIREIYSKRDVDGKTQILGDLENLLDLWKD